MAGYGDTEPVQDRRPSLRVRLNQLEKLVYELKEQLGEAQRHIGNLEDEVGTSE